MELHVGTKLEMHSLLRKLTALTFGGLWLAWDLLVHHHVEKKQ